jgi:hypothetical protein
MIMNRIKLLMALVGMSLGAASFAEEPGLCKSICATEKQECRAKTKRLTDLDRDVFLAPDGKNAFANANSQGVVAPPEARAREQADANRRLAERNGQCDATYLRCTRACDAPAHNGTDSVILKRKGEAKSGDRP